MVGTLNMSSMNKHKGLCQWNVHVLCRALLYFPEANPGAKKVKPEISGTVASGRNGVSPRPLLSQLFIQRSVHLTSSVFSSSLMSTFFHFTFTHHDFLPSFACVYLLISVLFHLCFHCLFHFVVSFRAFVCMFCLGGLFGIIQIMNAGLSFFMIGFLISSHACILQT